MSTPDGVHALIRRTHEEQIRRALRAHGGLTRGELAKRVGLSRTTLSDITSRLLQQGEIVVAEPPGWRARGSRGRPAERLTLDPNTDLLMGVDFGHRRVHIVVVDAAHDLVASGTARYATESSWPERVGVAFDLTERLGEQAGSSFATVGRLGIGFPGPFSPRMPEPVADGDGEPVSPSEYVRCSFRGRFGPGGSGAAILIDNNTRFAALAEAIWGTGADTADLVYIRLSDGIGGGLVVDGRLVTGSAGFAGEFGHIAIQSDGEDCRCGKRGCLETIASVPSILARCASLGVSLASAAELGEAVAKSDPVVDQVLHDAGVALGRVLGTLAVALNPAEIVIGGELVHAAPSVVAQAESSLRWELLPVRDIALRVRRAALGDDDGALGAVAALFHQSSLLDSYPSATPARPAGADRGRSAS